ncbi:type II secretion system protein GspE [Erwinia sp. CPCC 100877]|nr:type II secretion system protein GspE [Erwinia sp. CPCC 100877]
MPHEEIARLCRQHQAILLEMDEGRIRVAVPDEIPTGLMETLDFAGNRNVELEYWSRERLETYQHTRENSAPFSTAPQNAVELVSHTLARAVTRRASDIHIEPGAALGRIRLRIDGVLHLLTTFPMEMAGALVTRLKVLSNLDVAERRQPQDGRFTMTIEDEPLSLRISTLPCQNGEKVVLRLMCKNSRPLTPDALGMTPGALNCFRQALHSPQGLLLVTGPTGSGKTLTLYSGLSELNQPGVNISSVEDPVEIPLEGVTQTQIHPRAGLTFQAVLRALLRQDPDVIMVGEIRDSETAEIAIKAAQTGHLVLSTLHTHSAVQTLTRMEQMGVARWQIASALQLIIAQRLVRRLCSHCRTRGDTDIVLPSHLWPRPLPDWQPQGCNRCYGGFYERHALFELLPVDASLRQAIADDASQSELNQLASRQGQPRLHESGFQAVEQGLTTVQELWRVLGVAR